MSLLTVNSVGVRFGGVVALDDLSFTVEPGKICALIGPNGAGKTTLFNVLSRLYQPNQGTVDFDGHDLLHYPAHRIASRSLQTAGTPPGRPPMLMGRLEGRPYGNIPLEPRTLVPRVPCVPESG